MERERVPPHLRGPFHPYMRRMRDIAESNKLWASGPGMGGRTSEDNQVEERFIITIFGDWRVWWRPMTPGHEDLIGYQFLEWIVLLRLGDLFTMVDP